jgi:hypothetical protein
MGWDGMSVVMHLLILYEAHAAALACGGSHSTVSPSTCTWSHERLLASQVSRLGAW